MHPQLSDKRDACREFIEALDLCHSSSWKRLTGGCNEQKSALIQCLRKESRERSSRNRNSAKERRLKTEQAWKELHADD
ncbi:hypothetical protein JVT61DRAFT_2042 [Boletus reticuloceps]|uniref:COX assembly mitochondrial protein n=1 Tax=Boletus reticuloceps TaxID=495285 RepID=A0A8I2YSM2_9AGAM|nr:hypothetical protein JVT61DRAFT_2042 [Boletus reticuloceps]